MGSFGGFYKGEKKKKKKDQQQKFGITNAPTFSLPKIVSKKREVWVKEKIVVI